MNRILIKFVKRILLSPAVYEKFKLIRRFYKDQFYQKVKSGQIDYMLEILDIQDDFLYKDIKVLIEIVKAVLKEGIQIVEVGSWKGFSTYFLAKTILGYNGKVFAVDHWEGSKNVPIHAYAKMIDIFTIFKHNMIMLGVEKVVYPLKMDSQKASERFENGTLDLVFLDGDHRYESFRKDILSWFSKLRTGGVICGHDCEGYYEDYPKKLRNKIDKSLEKDFISPVGHPGVIKGLHGFFGKEYSIVPGSVVWYYYKKE